MRAFRYVFAETIFTVDVVIESLGLKQIYDLVGPEEWLGEGSYGKVVKIKMNAGSRFVSIFRNPAKRN